MRLAGTPRRFATWIAALAVLMAALAPAWSHALSAGEAAEWVSVCSAQGTKWVPGDADGSGVPAATHAFEHCPYCSVHAQLLDLPPAVAAVAPAAGQREAVTQAAPSAAHAARLARRAAARTPAEGLIALLRAGPRRSPRMRITRSVALRRPPDTRADTAVSSVTDLDPLDPPPGVIP